MENNFRAVGETVVILSASNAGAGRCVEVLQR